MKAAILGNGKIGGTIVKCLQEMGHQVNAVVDKGDSMDFGDADIVFESTLPDCAVSNIEKIAMQGKNLVIVTTGWYEQMEHVREIIQKAGVRAVWASNFSLGVLIYLKIIEEASKLFNKTPEYDIWATEIHHRYKVDAPSGTAKTIQHILLNMIERKTAVVEEKLDRSLIDNEFHFSSTRGGTVNFGHTVGFDSAADTIEIKHTARNRDGYATGAVKAAEWLLGKDPGFYSMDDFLKELFA